MRTSSARNRNSDMTEEGRNAVSFADQESKDLVSDQWVHESEGRTSHFQYVSIEESPEHYFASQTLSGSTYGPTIPVRISHPCRPNETMVGVARVDNQSYSLWVDKRVCDSLKIDPEFVYLEMFRLSTPERVDAEHQGRAIKGLRIAPYLSEPNTQPIVRDLPTCIEREREREIPPAQVEQEVATYEDVKEMKPHLRHYRCSFPCRKPWKPLVLLGRDCPWAMQQIVKNVPDEDQGLIMTQTPFGRILIGPKPELNQSVDRRGRRPTTQVACRKIENYSISQRSE